MKQMYIIKGYLEQMHHLLENKQDDPLSLRISCLQQIQYIILKNKFPDIEYIKIFCDDISIRFIELNNNEFKIEKSNSLLNHNLFKIESLETDEEMLLGLENWIKNGIPIILQTAFEMLSPYVWYNEKLVGGHNNHHCLIVGVDNKYFYFIDNHYVIEKKRDKTHPQNSTIHKMEKKELEKALKTFHSFKTLIIIPEEIKKINKISELISCIVNTYYKATVEYNNNGKIYSGKKALGKLVNAASGSQFSYLEKTFLNSHYPVHTIYSRHSILRECLDSDNKFNLHCERKNVIQQLDLCCKRWLIFKNIIQKNLIYKEDGFQTKILKQLNLIVKAEDKLMRELQHYITC